MTQPLTLIFGFLIIFTVTYLLISLFLYLYFKISKKLKEKTSEILSISLYLTLINIFVTFLVFIFLSFNIYVFVGASYILASIGFLFTLTKVKKINYIDGFIIAFGLPFILNPGWLTFIGIV